MEAVDLVKRTVGVFVFFVFLWIAYHIAKFLIGLVLLVGVVAVGYLFLKNKGIVK